MKLQMSARALRLRLSVAQFRTLLAGDALELALPVPGAPLRMQVATGDPVAFTTGDGGGSAQAGDLHLRLPYADLAGLASRLPSRDGLEYVVELGAARSVQLTIEVDVRDPDGRRSGAR